MQVKIVVVYMIRDYHILLYLFLQHVSDVFHPATSEGRSHVSVNSARWLPEAGGGIVYGTNRGDLNFYRAG